MKTKTQILVNFARNLNVPEVVINTMVNNGTLSFENIKALAVESKPTLEQIIFHL